MWLLWLRSLSYHLMPLKNTLTRDSAKSSAKPIITMPEINSVKALRKYSEQRCDSDCDNYSNKNKVTAAFPIINDCKNQFRRLPYPRIWQDKTERSDKNSSRIRMAKNTWPECAKHMQSETNLQKHFVSTTSSAQLLPRNHLKHIRYS